MPKYQQEEKGTTEDGMVGWHCRLDGHEFEQTPGVGDGKKIGSEYSLEDLMLKLKLQYFDHPMQRADS